MVLTEEEIAFHVISLFEVSTLHAHLTKTPPPTMLVCSSFELPLSNKPSLIQRPLRSLGYNKFANLLSSVSMPMISFFEDQMY